jgi:glycosyltransferase involved in cell wall biosynthesis
MAQRLHLVGLPHTTTTADDLSCAYTQKVVKFCRMMQGRGREIILYGSELNDAPCDEHVCIVSEQERHGWFGDHFDTVTSAFSWEAEAKWWQTANRRAATYIEQRAEYGDLVLLAAGTAQKPIADALTDLLCIEPFVGYEGIFTQHRAFESQAWMHWLYGKDRNANGHWFDTVIPNYFDPDEFPAGDGKGGYLLYLGRLVQRKGVETAAEIARALGMPLLVAGPGALEHRPGYLRSDEFDISYDGLEYVGEVGLDQRASLIAGAGALLAPTLYIEPFGGVAVEAMMCGTPAVTTDWGAFPETVKTGVSGYRFRNLAEGCQAVVDALELDRGVVREHALTNYSLAAVAPQFDRWLAQIETLWGDGWYQMPLQLASA